MVKEVYTTGTLLIDLFDVGHGIYLGLSDNKKYHVVYDFRKKKTEQLLYISFISIWKKA